MSQPMDSEQEHPALKVMRELETEASPYLKELLLMNSQADKPAPPRPSPEESR